MIKRTPRNVERQAAYLWVRSLERPDEIPKRRWRCITTLLEALAGFYPDIYPGEETLARRLRVHRVTVSHWVTWSAEAGLLTVEPGGGKTTSNGHFRTNRYHINLVSHPCSGKLHAPCSVKLHKSWDYFVTPVSTEKPEQRTSFSALPSAGLRPAKVGAVTDDLWEPPADEPLVPAPPRRRSPPPASPSDPNKRLRPRPTGRDRDPARRLVGVFERKWHEEVYEPRPDRRSVRVLDSVGEAVGYIRSTFLAPAEGRVFTEDDVRALITEFAQGAYRGLYRPKGSQTAWKLFTAVWGRLSTRRDDSGLYEASRRRDAAALQSSPSPREP